MTWSDSHVHHAELSFDQIVRSFAKERKVDIESLRYRLGSFVDQRLAHEFYEFHKEQCQLQVVHKDANMGTLKRKWPLLEKDDAEKGDEDSVSRKRRRKEEKCQMYDEIINHVKQDAGWREESKEAHWIAKLGGMWARLKKERRFKCGRTKAVVGGAIIRILRKTVPAEQKQ
jgi:hypothetical protein